MANRKTPAEVELNLAAMLDMAFQVLTFFILTFRPSPIEGQVELRMPPPKPLVVKSDDAAPQGNAVNPLADLRTLPIVLTAANNGTLAQVMVAGQNVLIDPRLALLNGALFRLLGDPASPFDQVIIEADPKIRYDEVMRVLMSARGSEWPDDAQPSKSTLVNDAWETRGLNSPDQTGRLYLLMRNEISCHVFSPSDRSGFSGGRNSPA